MMLSEERKKERKKENQSEQVLKSLIKKSSYFEYAAFLEKKRRHK
jgi:hypothetical protein